MKVWSNWPLRARIAAAAGAVFFGVAILLIAAAVEQENGLPPGTDKLSAHPGDLYCAGPVPSGQGQPGAFGQQSGQVWRGEFPQASSARQVAGQAMKRISAQLGAKVQPVGNAALADRQDQNFMMMFQTTQTQRPIRGVLRVSVVDGTGYVTAAWDAPGRDLTAVLNQPFSQPVSAAGSPPRPIQWQTVSLPNGAGSVRLPEGWRITSVNTPQAGALSAEGPQGGVDLGYAMQLLTPRAASMSWMPLPDTLPVAEYSTPARAVQDVFGLVARLNERTGQPGMRWGEILASEPAPATAGGQAAFVHYAWQRQAAGQWVPMESLAYVNIAPVGLESWMYYASTVSAPAPMFRQSVGVLAEIWSSWKVSDSVHTSRLLKAIQSQQDAFATQQQSYQYQQQVSDRVWKAWSEYNRGQQAVLDQTYGRVHHLDLRWADEVVRLANQHEGTERWIKVDPFQLDY